MLAGGILALLFFKGTRVPTSRGCRARRWSVVWIGNVSRFESDQCLTTLLSVYAYALDPRIAE